jgi:hypothetical protein
MGDLGIEAISGLPASGRRLCEQLLREPLESIPALRVRVERYCERIEAAAQSSKLFDVALARRIGEVLIELLTMSLAPEQHRAVHVAVRYFEEDDDSDPDFDSILGFEDDAQVVNAVLRFLGREDLLIEIP